MTIVRPGGNYIHASPLAGGVELVVVVVGVAGVDKVFDVRDDRG